MMQRECSEVLVTIFRSGRKAQRNCQDLAYWNTVHSTEMGRMFQCRGECFNAGENDIKELYDAK